MDELNPQAEELTAWIFKETQGVVQSGPFHGMQLLKDRAWETGSLSPALLGCYEEELHGFLEHEIFRLATLPNPKIVNIGCAEGYYAVGMARRLPNATVYIVDTDDKCLQIAHATAAANGVTLVSGKTLHEIFAEPDLIISDCEGAESSYLNQTEFPALAKATMIVEVHNHGHLDNDDQLRSIFSHSHSVDVVWEAGRNPNLYPLLYSQPSNARWAAVSEYRPSLMYWFVIKPLPVADTPALGIADRAVKKCGECTLCCKIEKILWLDKPANQWCKHCDIGVGCKIYEDRPRDCSAFECLWLRSPDMPEELRPDRVHHYAAGNTRGGYMKVCVDPDYPEAWKESLVVKYVTDKGFHALVQVGHQINFVKGHGKQMPLKLMLDWTL